MRRVNRTPGDHLARNVARRVSTIMVGALSAAERHLGFLVGMGQVPSPEDFTAEELRVFSDPEFQAVMRERWSAMRGDILKEGNDQISGSGKDVAGFSIGWNQ